MSWLQRFRRRDFSNREGLSEYDFRLYRSRARPGVSAMVRVKNEEQKIAHCLRSILGVFDEVVLVDNGSDDATASIVREFQDTPEGAAQIRLLSYPHRLARFGPEHGDTPEDSVHSAVYFTNWALSHCSYRFVCKWDGDMVLRRETKELFREFLRDIQSGARRCWVLAGQTVYRASNGEFFVARGEVNREVEIFPYSLACRFHKHPSWERLKRPFYFRKGEFAPVCFFELKYVDEDEFDHWSSTAWQTERKKREWANFQLVRNGQVNGDGFERFPASFLDSEVR
jgi:glycosyltransferase involved in cell wall biosynthesis